VKPLAGVDDGLQLGVRDLHRAGRGGGTGGRSEVHHEGRGLDRLRLQRSAEQAGGWATSGVGAARDRAKPPHPPAYVPPNPGTPTHPRTHPAHPLKHPPTLPPRMASASEGWKVRGSLGTAASEELST